MQKINNLQDTQSLFSPKIYYRKKGQFHQEKKFKNNDLFRIYI